MQRALLGGLLLAVACPLIGAFLVLRRMSLMGDGLGHVAFAGVGLGMFLGVNPVLTAGVTALVGALGIEAVRQRRRESGDLALAVFFYTGISAAAVLSGLAGQFNGSLLSYLFGSILTIAPAELWFIAGLAVAVVAVMAVAWRALLAVASDEEVAQTAGLPVRWLNALVAVLAAVTVTLAMRIVGILLVAALLVIPVAISLQRTKSFTAMLAVAVAHAILAVAVGLVAVFWLDLPPGGTIVLTLVGMFVLTLVWNQLAAPCRWAMLASRSTPPAQS